jgi:hypothetical protein
MEMDMTKQNATSGQPKYAVGHWMHLFGVGPLETHCRLVIDLEQSKLVAAQEWTGLKFEDVLGSRLKDLAESVIEVNEAHKNPDEWELDRVRILPFWARQSATAATEDSQDDTKPSQRDSGNKSFRVHLYVLTRVPVEVANASSQVDAIAQAVDATDLYEAVKTSEYAEEIHSALVDEVGDAEFTRTQHYQPGQEDGEWVVESFATQKERQAAATDALTKVDAAFESVNSLLDASGALDSEPLQKAVYQLRLEIARASGDPERTKAAQLSLQELSA